MGDEVGRGSYGEVRSATHPTHGTVAIKRIQDCLGTFEVSKTTLREVDLLRRIASFDKTLISTPVDLFFCNRGRMVNLFIVSPLFDTTLRHVIGAGKKEFSDHHVQYIMVQVAEGVRFLHASGIIHRDLKPDNILINADVSVAICDLGMARSFAAQNTSPVSAAEFPPENDENRQKRKCHRRTLTAHVVTRWYRCPELLINREDYGPEVDIWALGCVFAEILQNHKSFDAKAEPLFPGEGSALSGCSPEHSDQLLTIFTVLGAPSRADLSEMQSTLGPRQATYLRKCVGQVETVFRSTALVRLYAVFPVEGVEMQLMLSMLNYCPRDRPTATDVVNNAFFCHTREEFCGKSLPMRTDVDVAECLNARDWKGAAMHAITTAVTEFHANA